MLLILVLYSFFFFFFFWSEIADRYLMYELYIQQN